MSLIDHKESVSVSSSLSMYAATVILQRILYYQLSCTKHSATLHKENIFLKIWWVGEGGANTACVHSNIQWFLVQACKTATE